MLDERSHFSSYDRWNPDVLYASIVSLMDGRPILTFKFRGRETSRQLFGGSIDKEDRAVKRFGILDFDGCSKNWKFFSI